jgi:hypothetical protein
MESASPSPPAPSEGLPIALAAANPIFIELVFLQALWHYGKKLNH